MTWMLPSCTSHCYACCIAVPTGSELDLGPLLWQERLCTFSWSCPKNTCLLQHSRCPAAPQSMRVGECHVHRAWSLTIKLTPMLEETYFLLYWTPSCQPAAFCMLKASRLVWSSHSSSSLYPFLQLAEKLDPSDGCPWAGLPFSDFHLEKIWRSLSHCLWTYLLCTCVQGLFLPGAAGALWR